MPNNQSAEVNSSASRIGQMVRTDRLRLLFHQSFPALFISIAMAVLLSWMLWPNTEATAVLQGWLALLSVSTLARLALFIRYFRAERDSRDLLRWERPYFVTLLVSSSIWGIGAAVLLPRVSALDQAVTLFVLVGMAGGAVSTYSAYRAMAIAAMSSVLVPGTLWFFYQPHQMQIGMAIGATVFMLASLRATRVLANSLLRNFQLTHELKAARDIADQLARTDPLTGINNRRAFFEIGQKLISYCQRKQSALAMLLIDVDHFKSINDSFGHAIGDIALKQVGNLLQKTFRKSDVYGRIGGEEFAVLLPDTEPADAKQLAETLRNTIAQTPLQLADRQLTITVSIGIAGGTGDIETLLLQSDLAMYTAKQEGRNRVIAYC